MDTERRGRGPRPMFGELYYYGSTPELKDKLSAYHAMGEELIPPIRILRDWGFDIPNPSKLNRFIIERWPGVFPVLHETLVRIPAQRTEEFLLLFEKDPYSTRPVHSPENQEVMDNMMNNAGVYLQIRIR